MQQQNKNCWIMITNHLSNNHFIKQGCIVNIALPVLREFQGFGHFCRWDGLGLISSSFFFSSDSVGAATAPRGEVKTAGRRTSAPPVVNTQGQQQRALLREKSKENQLDRNGCLQQDKDSDKSCFDIGKYHQ